MRRVQKGSDAPAYIALLLALLAAITAVPSALSSDPDAGFGLTFLFCAAAFILAIVALFCRRTVWGTLAALVAAIVGGTPYVLFAFLVFLALVCDDCFA